MRAFLLLFLCLLIPIQGVSAAHASKAPCSMEQGRHAGVMDGSDTTDDCCNDAVVVAKTGQLCKPGQDCQSGGLGILVPLVNETSPYVGSIAVVTFPQFVPTLDPPSVWRPPALS